MASGAFCVDEDAVLAAHRVRLLAMPADAFRVRAELAKPSGRLLALPESFADPTVRASIVDRLLSRECVAEQHNLGFVMQYAHTPYMDAVRAANSENCALMAAFLAAMPPRAALGDLSRAPEEALGWFLAAARHGDAAAMENVAPYLEAARNPGCLDLERLTSWPHAAAFYLWKAMQHGAPADSPAQQDHFLFSLQHLFVPLALKDAQGTVEADTVKRLVRLLHTGPHLATAAAPPYEDPAAQFLLGTQLLGSPAPRLRMTYEEFDRRPGSSWMLVTYVTIELHDATGGSTKPRRAKAKAKAKAKARTLLQASAAAGFEPAISFLAAAGADLRDVAAALGPTPAALLPWYDHVNRDGVPSMCHVLVSYDAQATRTQAQRDLERAVASGSTIAPEPGLLRNPGERCERCGRTDVKMKLCGKCRAARYCSEACQRAAWKQHKKTCVPVEAP